MDHEALLATLSPAERAALTERADGPGLRHLALHLAAIGLTTIWIVFAGPLWPIALILHGILLVFLFTLEHECTHQTPFKTPWINELVGHLCSIPLILPFQWFRYFHLAHHRFTNDPENDPELAGDGRPDTWRAYVIYVSGWSYWRNAIRTLIINALGRAAGPYLPKSRIKTITWEARALMAIYVIALLFAPITLFWLWVLPMLLACQFCGSICWPNMAIARRWPICSRTRARHLPIVSSGSSPGTCPITPSIMLTRRCHFTNCRDSMRSRGSI